MLGLADIAYDIFLIRLKEKKQESNQRGNAAQD